MKNFIKYDLTCYDGIYKKYVRSSLNIPINSIFDQHVGITIYNNSNNEI